MGRGRHADSPSGSSQHSLSKHNKSQFGSMSSLAASSVSTVTHATIDTGSLSPVQLCHLGTYFLDVKAPVKDHLFYGAEYLSFKVWNIFILFERQYDSNTLLNTRSFRSE